MIAKEKGFTLIELIVYMAVSVVVLLGIASFFIFLLYAQTSSLAVAEIDEQGQAAMTLMTQDVRNATAIVAPAPGATSSVLVIQPLASSTATTTFGLSGAFLTIQEGTSAPIPLTISRAAVTSLTFTNLTPTGTPGIVRMQFTIAHVKTESPLSYDASETLYDSAGLRP